MTSFLLPVKRFSKVCLWVVSLGFLSGTEAGTMGPTTSSSAHFYLNLGVGAIFSDSSTRFTSDSNSILYSPTALGTSLFTLKDVSWNNQFKNGFDFNLAVGQYYNKHWRGELEFLYQDMERDGSGTYTWVEQNSTTAAVYAIQPNNLISTVAARARLYSFLVDLAYDFTAIKKWQPLLAGGVGVAWLRSGSVQTNNLLNINDPATPLIETAPANQYSPSLYGTAFAWQVKAGLAYAVSDRATAVLQYRLYGSTQFKGSASSIVTSPGTTAQSNFYMGQQDIRGLLIQAVELSMRFDV